MSDDGQKVVLPCTDLSFVPLPLINEQVGERLYDHRFEWHCRLQPAGPDHRQPHVNKGLRLKVGGRRWTKVVRLCHGWGGGRVTT